MTVRKPLVRIDGGVQQLPAGDVLPQAAVENLVADLADKMTNPMTTAGDMIRGGTSGAPERVAAGTNGYVWTMVSGVPGWAAAGSDPWLSKPIGEPFPIWDHIAGVPVPPTDNAGYRYIKLTASDSYNAGVLTSESVSGSAPEVQATAAINLAGSPMNGQTVRLINTEQRFVRAGTSGGVANHALASHSHGIAIGAVSALSGTYATWVHGGYTSDGYLTTNFTAIQAVGGTETHPKYIGATYYMRIR